MPAARLHHFIRASKIAIDLVPMVGTNGSIGSYYEACANIVAVIEREKQIKGWSRKKKQDLINTLNPEWDDLYRSLC